MVTIGGSSRVWSNDNGDKSRGKMSTSRSTSSKDLQQVPLALTTADRYIAQLRSPKPTIRSISLAGNDITEENVGAFAAALLGNKSVTYLALFCVRGGDTNKGSSQLAASAMSLSSLRTLSWSNVFEGGYAVRVLAQGLKESKTLARVMFMDSKFKNEDIVILSQALESNTSIETLGLECCDVTDEGAFALSKMVKNNKTIRTLGLSENGITDLGATALLESIFDTKSFNSIWLSNHTITSFSRECTHPYVDAETVDFCHVSHDLRNKMSKILEINRNGGSPANVGRHKIALHMEINFDSSWIEDLNEKVVPHILSWCGRTASFEILRNMPDLLNVGHTHNAMALPCDDTKGEEQTFQAEPLNRSRSVFLRRKTSLDMCSKSERWVVFSKRNSDKPEVPERTNNAGNFSQNENPKTGLRVGILKVIRMNTIIARMKKGNGSKKDAPSGWRK